MAPAHRGRVHLDGPAGDRVLQPPALLRPRADRRGGEGLTFARTPQPVSGNRRWAAIAVGTLFVVVSFWAMAYGLAVANAGTPADPGASGTVTAAYGVGLAVLLIPFALIAVALISRRQDWPLMVFYAMGLSLGVGLPLLIFGNPLASLIAGYAAAAVMTVSRPPGLGWHHRAIAAAVVTLLALGGMMVAFTVTAVFAPALPFMAVGVADSFAPRPTS